MENSVTPIPVPEKTSLVPNGATQRWDTIKLGIRLGSVVILTAAIVGFMLLSGKAITVEQIILIIVAGGALAGLTAARPSGSAGGGASVLGGVLLMLATILGGCSGAAIVPDPHPGDGIDACEIEDSIVEGLAVAVDDVDEVLPDDSPKASDGILYALGVIEEGRAAVGVCQALVAEGRSGLAAVIPWISVAASVVRGIISILTAAHVSIPESILGVLHSLGLAQAELGQEAGPETWALAKGPSL